MSDTIITLPENVENSLIALIKQKGFLTYEIKLSPGSKKGDNFSGIVTKVEVTGVKLNEVFERLNLFVKVPVDDAMFIESFQIHEVFLTEIHFYNDIVTEFKTFQKEKNLTDGFKCAELLAAGKEQTKEFLIMNDLTSEGFLMVDKTKQLDFEHVKLVLKELGKLHALSLALKDQKPKIFQKYKQSTAEKRFVNLPDGVLKSYIASFLKGAVDSLKFEGKYKTKWKKFHENYFEVFEKCVLEDIAEPHAVICHADCWPNNIMFKYEGENVTELRFVDWQLIRYASPVTDVVSFLFFSTDKSFRKTYYESLLNIYYDSLKDFLLKLGSDADVLFPYSVFRDHLKRFGKFGLVSSIVLVPNNSTPSEDAVSMDKLLEDTSVVINNEKTKEFCRQRLFDIVVDMVDLGYL